MIIVIPAHTGFEVGAEGGGALPDGATVAFRCIVEGIEDTVHLLLLPEK